MKNKWIFGLVAAALSSLSLVEAQAPPPTPAPPPDAGPMSRVSGSVSQFNYDPEGRIEGFLLTPRTLVFLPPEEAMQAEASIKRGERVDVTGSLQSSPNGMQIMDAETIRVGGKMISGAENHVRLRVASLPDFAIMKAHAIGARDKPKDVYDLCHCLDAYPGGIRALAEEWRRRRDEPLIAEAIRILGQKFASVDHYGPKQLAVFHNAQDADQDAIHVRRAYELVQRLLGSV